MPYEPDATIAVLPGAAPSARRDLPKVREMKTNPDRRRRRAHALAVESLESRTLFTLPSGFAQTTFASGLSAPTAMAFAPDGRMFVLEQDGAIRVVTAGGTVLSTPFATVPAKTGGEQGLLGIAFAPDFATSREVFIHWITGSSQNRVSRFTADASNPNVAAAGSQVDILTLPQDPNFGYNHQGGALGFGIDGKIYLTVGEHNTQSYAQNLTSPFGKILRLNRDGSFPSDNPFYATSSGWGQAVWALGLRNPYSFAFQPGTGALLINDVGGGLREEVNRGIAGANYGWPTTEGTFNPSTYPQFTNPVYDYERGTVGCAIIGGSFYNPRRARATRFRPVTSENISSATIATGLSVRSTPPTATPLRSSARRTSCPPRRWTWRSGLTGVCTAWRAGRGLPAGRASSFESATPAATRRSSARTPRARPSPWASR